MKNATKNNAIDEHTPFNISFWHEIGRKLSDWRRRAGRLLRLAWPDFSCFCEPSKTLFPSAHSFRLTSSTIRRRGAVAVELSAESSSLSQEWWRGASCVSPDHVRGRGHFFVAATAAGGGGGQTTLPNRTGELHSHHKH